MMHPKGFKWIEPGDPDYNKDGNWSGPIDLRETDTNALEVIEDIKKGNISKIIKMSEDFKNKGKK